MKIINKISCNKFLLIIIIKLINCVLAQEVLDTNKNVIKTDNSSISNSNNNRTNSDNHYLSDGPSISPTTILNHTVNDSLLVKSNSSIEIIGATNTTNSSLSQFTLPSTCEDYQVLKEQPKPFNLEKTKFNKCCQTNNQYYNGDLSVCKPNKPEHQQRVPNPNIVEAKLYHDCIEDLETNLTFTFRVNDECHKNRVVFSENEKDNIYIIQDGTLLTFDDQYLAFDIYDEYCLEYDDDILIAIVCLDGDNHKLSEFQTHLTAICMLISVPCLLLTAFFHLAIPKLRCLHGETLACHSICLACGFGLLGLYNIKVITSDVTGYFISYFIVACFFWMLMNTIDITINVWYFVPNQSRDFSKYKNQRIIIYSVVAMGASLILTIATITSGLSGDPSYYLKGEDHIQSSQKFFIPPICFIIGLNFILFIGLYYGFHRQNELDLLLWTKQITDNGAGREQTQAYREMMTEVKRSAKSSVLLFSIMSVNWIFEIISFLGFKLGNFIIIFDVLNGLQGILIFIIFVCFPHYAKIIKNWWVDRGSCHIEPVEMQPLNNKNRSLP